jgi:hypothetical protein
MSKIEPDDETFGELAQRKWVRIRLVADIPGERSVWSEFWCPPEQFDNPDIRGQLGRHLLHGIDVERRKLANPPEEP